MPEKNGSDGESLLNYHFFLQRLYAATRVLRGDSDQVLPVWKRRREILERAIGSYRRDFLSIHHHSRCILGLSFDLDYVPMLHQRGQFQCNRNIFRSLADHREPVLFALNGGVSVNVL